MIIVFLYLKFSCPALTIVHITLYDEKTLYLKGRTLNL